MIKTDLTYLENDLTEVVNLFEEAENLNIRHIYSRGENKVVNTLVFGGKSFAYGNLVKDSLDPVVQKRLIKRYAKLSLYKALSAYYDVQKPWGALTGIRPTKLAYQAIEEGLSVKDFFINTLKVSEKKTELIESIINSQKGIYTTQGNLTDFFVFIPFCPSRCRYCSFITADVKSAEKKVDEYVEVLIKEINQSKKFIKNLRSIYIGGGTPVALSDEQFNKVLSSLDQLSGGVEYTVEAGRPDRITKEKVDLMQKHGVTRVCLNPQTFNDKTLELIGRKHTSNDICSAHELLRGKFKINMDLIAGLDGESFEDFKYSLDRAISFNPENVTVHTLCIKKGSNLAQGVNRLFHKDVEKMIDYSHEALINSGYLPYYTYRQKYMASNLENTGYAKKGTECVYNIDVMEEISDNVACGAGSISKKVFLNENRIERQANPKDVNTYISKIDKILAEKQEIFS